MKLNLPELAGALVLAGGQSRRMGQDKALLQLQGEALLARTCRTALAAIDASQPGVARRVLVITARPDYQSLLPRGCELRLEDDPQGPLNAFAQGVEQLEAADGWVLLLACDLPLLTVEDLVGAIAHLPDLSPEVDAYLPPAASETRLGKGSTNKQLDWEPLCGFYRQRCLNSLNEVITQGTRSFQRWLKQLNVAPLTHWPSKHLLNCNRPEDWAEAREIVGELQVP